MKLKVIGDDGSVKVYVLDKEHFYDKSLMDKVGYIGTQSKEENVLKIMKAYFSNAKIILFDETNKVIAKQLEYMHICNFPKENLKNNIFQKSKFSFMYYTSGTTGDPIGALKEKSHLLEEVKVLTTLLQNYHIKKVIVTVPFIHLYGTLLGLIYPLVNDIDIVIKEHFLPHDILNLIEENTLVVTTPLYVQALSKMSVTMDLSSSLFISSTAPLEVKVAQQFNQKFNTDIMQIFGSTETGGIAYKLNDEILWTPFDGVDISTNENQELKVSSPFVSDVLYENGFHQINGVMQTFDYIEKKDEKFKLIGRSSKILKLAGKRYSTIQIENILENIDDIRRALVFVGLEENSLRGEYLDITLESDKNYTSNEIKNILKEKLSNLKFMIRLKRVEHIPVNQVGKKLRIK